MLRKAFVLFFAVFLYSTVMYGVHLFVDNYGADIGTAARVVYKLKTDPSFILSIDPADIDLTKENSRGDELLKNDTYAVGPKFVLYLLATLVYWLLSFPFPGIDPLSALFFTNLFSLLGSSFIIYAITVKSGSVSNRLSALLLPVLLLSLPSTYYLAYYPSYPHVIVLFLLSSIYFVIRAYEGQTKRLVLNLLLSGFVLGLTAGVGSQAPLCIFFGMIFTAQVAFRKHLLIKSLFLLSLGILIAILLSEFAYWANGASFIKLTWLHVHENVYANHLKEPFPFIPLVYFRILFALTPVSLVLFLAGACCYPFWRKSVSLEARSIFVSLLVLLAALSFLPNTPLFRIFFPFFIIMQICIFIMITSIKKKVVRNAIIAVLLFEVLLTLPSALFISRGHSEFKSPITRFDDERSIVRYFHYNK